MRKVLALVALAAAALAGGVGGAAAVVIDFGTVTGRTVFDIPARQIGAVQSFDDTYTFNLASSLFDPGRGFVKLTLTIDQRGILPTSYELVSGPNGALLLTGPGGPGTVQPIFGDELAATYVGFPTVPGSYNIRAMSIADVNGGSYRGKIDILPLPGGGALIGSALGFLALARRRTRIKRASCQIQ